MTRGPRPTKHIDILWAAIGLFARQGVAQTSTREIAAAARTTERTLFKHFGSKDGLVRAVIDEAVLPHLVPGSLDSLRRAVEAQGGDLAAWHRGLLTGRAQAIEQAPDLARLLLVELLRDAALRQRFAVQWQAAVWQPLTGLFTRLQAEGRLTHRVSAQSLARLFLSLNLGYLVARFAIAPGMVWNDADEIDAVARLFARGAAPD
ncbi:helix-turn-helix domain-containing protein [Ferrovibrio sp.]|uniref:TetR/AcrR family transcriptional regulator n=1 Tax=Ferrovibrio sp. TaxID=1917215 RepID=UPI00311F771C